MTLTSSLHLDSGDKIKVQNLGGGTILLSITPGDSALGFDLFIRGEKELKRLRDEMDAFLSVLKVPITSNVEEKELAADIAK